MKDENYESEFVNDRKQELENFTAGFISFLKTKSVWEAMQELFENLQLELFIWSKESPNATSTSLNDDELKPTRIKSGQIINIEKNAEKVKEYIKTQEKKNIYLFSPVSNVLFNSSSEYVGEFCILWGIVLNAATRTAEKIMAEVLLDFLQCSFNSLDDLSTTEVSVWEEKEEQTNFDLMLKYVKKVFQKQPIPSENIVRKISYQYYEKSEVCASVYFVNKTVCTKLKGNTEHSFAWIAENDSTNDMNNDNNVSSSRKMLETCREENVLLVQTGDDDKCPIVAVVKKEFISNEPSECILEFLKRGEWRLLVDGDIILEYREGIYGINNLHFKSKTLEKVQEIDLISIENQTKFQEIFDCLNKCSHGALMIVGEQDDIKEEAERLSNLFKGTMLEKELDLMDSNNLPLVQGLASIDGAVMVDYNGMCYGFGIILDGKAIVPGDAGRGSRYNSAKNYVANHKGYAVVFSEDKEKGIEVINGNTLSVSVI